MQFTSVASMNFLPIVERELRVAARRPKVYRTRIILAALATLVVGLIVKALSTFLAPIFGGGRVLMLFGGISRLLFFGCLAAGVGLTSDSLSEEKREGTLGLLFLTSLRGFDIVLGKLTATSLITLYNLLGMMPVLSLLIIFGGIGWGTFFHVMLCLVNTLFFSASVGMFVSSISRQRQRAKSASACLLAFWWMVLPNLSILFLRHRLLAPYVSWLNVLSPSASLNSALGGSGRFSTHSFWSSLLGIHLFSWVWLGMASWIVPRTWQDKPASAPKLAWREKVKQLSYGSLAARVARRRQMLEKNAIYWLSFRNRFKAAPIWSFLIIIFAFSIWLAAKSANLGNNLSIFVVMLLVCNITVKCAIAGAASQFIAQEKASGALEWILSTPLRVYEIVWGQILALRQQFLGPILLLLTAEISLLVAGPFFFADLRKDTDLAFWVGCGAGVIVTLLLDSIALAWVGLWTGISFKNQRKVSSATLSQVIALPIAIFLLGAAGVEALRELRGIHPTPWLGIIAWFGLGIVIDITWIYAARRLLHRRMRALASPWVS